MTTSARRQHQLQGTNRRICQGTRLADGQIEPLEFLWCLVVRGLDGSFATWQVLQDERIGELGKAFMLHGLVEQFVEPFVPGDAQPRWVGIGLAASFAITWAMLRGLESWLPFARS